MDGWIELVKINTPTTTGSLAAPEGWRAVAGRFRDLSTRGLDTRRRRRRGRHGRAQAPARAGGFRTHPAGARAGDSGPGRPQRGARSAGRGPAPERTPAGKRTATPGTGQGRARRDCSRRGRRRGARPKSRTGARHRPAAPTCLEATTMCL